MPYASYQEQAKYEEDFVTKLDSKKNYSFTVSLHQNFSDLLQNSGIQDMYLQREIFNATDSNTQKFLSVLSLPDSTDAIPVTTYFQALKEDGTYDQHAIQSMLAEQYLYRPFVYEQYTQKTETDALQAVYGCVASIHSQTNLNPVFPQKICGMVQGRTSPTSWLYWNPSGSSWRTMRRTPLLRARHRDREILSTIS